MQPATVLLGTPWKIIGHPQVTNRQGRSRYQSGRPKDVSGPSTDATSRARNWSSGTRCSWTMTEALVRNQADDHAAERDARPCRLHSWTPLIPSSASLGSPGDRACRPTRRYATASGHRHQRTTGMVENLDVGLYWVMASARARARAHCASSTGSRESRCWSSPPGRVPTRDSSPAGQPERPEPFSAEVVCARCLHGGDGETATLPCVLCWPCFLLDLHRAMRGQARGKRRIMSPHSATALLFQVLRSGSFFPQRQQGRMELGAAGGRGAQSSGAQIYTPRGRETRDAWPRVPSFPGGGRRCPPGGAYCWVKKVSGEKGTWLQQGGAGGRPEVRRWEEGKEEDGRPGRKSEADGVGLR